MCKSRMPSKRVPGGCSGGLGFEGGGWTDGCEEKFIDSIDDDGPTWSKEPAASDHRGVGISE